MIFRIKRLDTTTRNVLIDTLFEVRTLTGEGDWTEVTTPTGWTRQDVGVDRAFLIDPERNLRAELIKTANCTGWYLVPRSPFTVMSHGCSSATVLHHNTPVYTGTGAHAWLDECYPNWRNPANYWEKP